MHSNVLFVFHSKMPVQCFSDVNLYITRILLQRMLIVIWKFLKYVHVSFTSACLIAKLIQGLGRCVKGHSDSVDVTGGAGACPELKKTERKENYSNICIYVPLWSNIQNQLQDCIKCDSFSHLKTGIIRVRPSVKQKYWQVQKERQ